MILQSRRTSKSISFKIIMISLFFVFVFQLHSQQSVKERVQEIAENSEGSANLIKNGNFEDVKNGAPLHWSISCWDTQNPSVFTVTPGRTGSSYTIRSSTPNDARISQTVQVEPDTIYKFSGWIKAAGIKDSNLGANLSENGITETSEDVKNTGNKWVYTQLIGKTGPGQNTLNLTLRLGGYGHTSIGTAAFDDISFVKLNSGKNISEIVSFYNQPVVVQEQTQPKISKKIIPGKLLSLALVVLVVVLFAFLPVMIKRYILPVLNNSGLTQWSKKLQRWHLQYSSPKIAFSISLIVLFFTWGILLLYLFGQIIIRNSSGIIAGFEHVWADFPLHFSIASIFAYRSPINWFAHHPLYYGGKMTYPFLMDFISGMLMRSGMPLYWAFVIPSCVFALLVLYGVYVLSYTVLKSNKSAFLAVSIFMLSSGLGVYKYIIDYVTSPGFSSLMAPLKFYTRFDAYQWYSGNIIHGIFLPQRAYLMGMTTAVWSLAGLISSMNMPVINSRSKIKILFAALGTGLLPITHMHSFLAIFTIAGFYCIVLMITNRKTILPLLLYYILPAGLLSSILFFTFVGGKTDMGHFFTWFPGFTSKGGILNWTLMWLKLFGLAVPLAAAGLVLSWRNISPAIRAFFVSFFVLFIVANLIKFQAVPWDNSKIFFWAYLGFAMLAAVVIIQLYKRKTATRICALLFLVSLVSTGVLDIEKIVFGHRKQYQIENNANIALAEEIREKTNDLDLFLTAASHNHFIMAFAARPIFMGFPGWIANFGYDYSVRKNDTIEMYRGTLQSKELLAKYKVSYVAVGGEERRSFKANEEFFSANFPIAFSNRYYTIYDVRSLWYEKEK